MHYFKRRLMFLAVCGVIVLTGLFYQSAHTTTKVVERTTVSSNTMALEQLTLPGLDEQTYSLSQWMDKPLIITFFTSWCEVCGETLPTLARYYNEHKEHVQMVAINATEEERSQEDVKSFVQAAKVTFPVLYDENGEAMSIFRVGGVPTTFIVNTDGVIQETFYGPVSFQQLYEAVTLFKK